MTVFTNKMHEIAHLTTQLSMLKPSSLVGQEQVPSQDTVDTVQISAEAMKQQILDQARTEVLARIRNTR